MKQVRWKNYIASIGPLRVEYLEEKNGMVRVVGQLDVDESKAVRILHVLADDGRDLKEQMAGRREQADYRNCLIDLLQAPNDPDVIAHCNSILDHYR